MSDKPQPKRGRPPGPEAHFRRIADALRKRLLAGEWAAGSVLPSVRSLAEHYGVGKRTVWLAVEAMKHEARVKVNPHRRLIAQTNASAYSLAGNLILEVIGNGLDDIMPKVSDSEMQRGIMLAAGELNLPLAVVHHPTLRDNLPTEFLELPLGGILLWGQIKLPVLRRYASLPLPVVLMDRPEETWKGRSVCVDNVSAACEATLRIAALGHKRIAFLRYIQMGLKDVDADSKERQRGFLQGLSQAGLPSNTHSVFNIFPKEAACKASMKALLDARPRFTAVLSADTNGARLVTLASQARGLRIPKDLSVACFQGIIPSHPHVSGPRIDFTALGRISVQVLKAPSGPATCVRVPAVWTEGETLAPPSL